MSCGPAAAQVAVLYLLYNQLCEVFGTKVLSTTVHEDNSWHSLHCPFRAFPPLVPHCFALAVVQCGGG